MDFLKHIGERIRTRILNRGYASIEIYAHEHRIPKSTLSEIITGKNDPRLTTLAKICAGLEITLSELFRDPSVEEWVREKAPAYIARRPSSPRKTIRSAGNKKA